MSRKPTIRAGERIIARGKNGAGKPGNANLARVLGMLGIPKASMAVMLQVPVARLDEDPAIAAELLRGRAEGDVEVAKALLTAARRGNVTASIFLAKARLGWSDQGNSNGAGAAGFLVETRPKAATTEEWASEYGPMRSPPTGGEASAGQEG